MANWTLVISYGDSSDRMLRIDVPDDIPKRHLWSLIRQEIIDDDEAIDAYLFGGGKEYRVNLDVLYDEYFDEVTIDVE